jgi:hypothetical protein
MSRVHAKKALWSHRLFRNLSLSKKILPLKEPAAPSEHALTFRLHAPECLGQLRVITPDTLDKKLFEGTFRYTTNSLADSIDD